MGVNKYIQCGSNVTEKLRHYLQISSRHNMAAMVVCTIWWWKAKIQLSGHLSTSSVIISKHYIVYSSVQHVCDLLSQESAKHYAIAEKGCSSEKKTSLIKIPKKVVSSNLKTSYSMMWEKFWVNGRHGTIKPTWFRRLLTVLSSIHFPDFFESIYCTTMSKDKQFLKTIVLKNCGYAQVSNNREESLELIQPVV